ncbi:MAG TPA: hypothetical protein VJ810_04325 [Blastocatellia bacterium]|nr:hypothetical protein [Blastocatellia bacterium]
MFFKLMLPLQAFVNLKLGLIPDCSTAEAVKRLDSEPRLKLREALYGNIGLIDQFVKENPEGFNDEELGIVQSWSKFIAGDFYIERYLAKHAIFIKNENVYAVLALHDPFDFFVGREELPVYTKTVLLPFKGRIVYDGLMQNYRVYFGSGIRGSLRETYLTAKQNGRIIESLDPATQKAQKNKAPRPARDWRAEVDALRAHAQILSAGAGTPPIQGAVFNLVKTSLEMAAVSAHQADDLEELWDCARKVERALRKIQTTLNRAE